MSAHFIEFRETVREVRLSLHRPAAETETERQMREREKAAYERRIG